ncbi:MAG: OmpA family protein [Limnohabitans sp.]|nr:OmpA family protein [Limnohabitans sp.]
MCKKQIIIVFIIFFSFNCFSQEQFSVYFESNKFLLNSSQKASLSNWILENKNSKILAMNGYTDEDGSNQYNDTLSLKRVECIFKNVNGKVKIREDFKKISFGESHNQSKNKAENRKVVIYFLKEKDLYKEAEILAGKLGTQKIKEKVKEKINFPAKIEVVNFDGSKSEIPLDVAFMESLNNAKPGEKLKLNNLNFVLNTFAIVKESRPKLYELLTVMQQNPKLKIGIQGHLCCITEDKKGLSTQRAKAIKQFLEINGIDSSRMTFKGFGGSNPLFAIPEKTEEEKAANRRVEIEIIEN